LGTEFARLLAAQGYDLILSARRRERLVQLRGKLQAVAPCDVQLVIADLADPDGAEKLCSAVDALDHPLDLLINNAGFGYYGPFLEQTPHEIDNMLTVNIRSATVLLRHYAAQMAARHSGGILQVSSYAGLQPTPRYSVYSAAKAYGIALIQSLRYEFRKQNVRASVLAPGFMNTEFHAVARHAKTRLMRWLTLDAAAVAAAGLAGVARNRLIITPGWMYKLNNLAASFLPRSVGSSISAAVVKCRGEQRIQQPLAEPVAHKI